MRARRIASAILHFGRDATTQMSLLSREISVMSGRTKVFGRRATMLRQLGSASVEKRHDRDALATHLAPR
jgi:hypothetical protein